MMIYMMIAMMRMKMIADVRPGSKGSGCKYEPITGGPQVPVDTMINFPIYVEEHTKILVFSF